MKFIYFAKFQWRNRVKIGVKVLKFWGIILELIPGGSTHSMRFSLSVKNEEDHFI